jgi:hypothetical protein
MFLNIWEMLSLTAHYLKSVQKSTQVTLVVEHKKSFLFVRWYLPIWFHSVVALDTRCWITTFLTAIRESSVLRNTSATAILIKLSFTGLPLPLKKYDMLSNCILMVVSSFESLRLDMNRWQIISSFQIPGCPSALAKGALQKQISDCSCQS